MLQSVDEVNIKDTLNFGVKDGEPIILDLLLVAWQTLQIQLRQCVANSVELVLLIWNGMSHLWGCCSSWIRVGNWLIELGGRWPTRSTISQRPAFAWAWRCGRLWWLRIAVG